MRDEGKHDSLIVFDTRENREDQNPLFYLIGRRREMHECFICKTSTPLLEQKYIS